MLVAPSILSADFGRLNEEIEELNKTDCDYLHIDVMDGHFVPNLTFGKNIIEVIAKKSTKPFDIHLMVQNVDFFVEMLIDVCPYGISFHIEEVKHVNRLLQAISKNNIKAGIAVNPHTSIDILEFVLEYTDYVLLMSVNPGFGGQNFIPNVLNKATKLKKCINSQKIECEIWMDGGINDKNIHLIKQSGVDVVIAGNYIFNSQDYQEAINSIR